MRFGYVHITGDVTLLEPLDYEERAVYQIIVVATDNGVASIPSTGELIINVLDLNDHAPRITLDDNTNVQKQLSVRENQLALTVVSHVYIEDLDSGQNGDVSCTSVSRFFQLHQLYTDMYELLTSRELDREETRIHNVTIRCVDHGTPSFQSEEVVSVEVLDVDDNTPRCDRNVYFVNVTEGNMVDVLLMHLHCIDDDLGENGELDYICESPVITISHTGTVYTNHVFDYETARQHRIRVSVADRGSGQHHTRIHIVIDILNINDQPPTFPQHQYDMFIDENMSPYSLVGKITALSNEPPPFNETRYFIDNQHAAWQLFDVNLVTGELFAVKSLDREASYAYNVTLLAVNAQDSSLRTSTLVTVFVNDVNDNSPICGTSQNITISTHIQNGDVLTTVNVIDLDDISNTQHNYFLDNITLQDIAIPSIFDIDLYTGTIRVRDVDLLYQFDSFSIQVGVLDASALNNFNTTCRVNISISDRVNLILYTGSSINTVVMIIISCSTCFLIVTLIVAILLVRRSQKRLTSLQQFKSHPVQIDELNGDCYVQAKNIQQHPQVGRLLFLFNF